MDYDKYKNTIEYPRQRRILDDEIAKLDEILLTRAERDAAEMDAIDRATQMYSAAQSAYNAEESRLRNLFFADAHEELDIAHLPATVLANLDALAWDRGHSAGYCDVLNAMYDLAELADVAYEAGKQDSE